MAIGTFDWIGLKNWTTV